LSTTDRPSRLPELFLVPLVAAVAAAGVWLGGDFTIRYACAFILVLVLPGFGVLRCALGSAAADVRPLECIVLSLGASYAVAVAATLALYYVPGPFTLRLALPVYFAAAAGPWALSWWQRRRGASVYAPLPNPPGSNAAADPLDRVHPGELVALMAILVLAAVLFFFQLGASEFQGDETMNLFDAGSALRGDDTALFFHRKGPAEIALPMALWGLSGSVTEASARLPFAWAGLLAVAGVYLVGRRLAGHRAGLIASALLALNGFVIGFSRIVQYQSIVLMAGILAVLCFAIFSEESGSGGSRFQVAGALFLALGLLAHYDGVFALPPVAYLYWRRAGLDWRVYRRIAPAFLAALAVGLGLLALFYGPFWRSGSLAQTSEYLAFRSGGELLYNNLAHAWWLSTTYNSTYYVACLAAAACALLLMRARGVRRRVVAVGLCLAMASVVAWPGLWRAWAFAPFLVGAAIFYVWLRSSPGANAAFVWFVVPFLVYSFFGVKRPGTHFWTLYAGLILLAAMGLAAFWRRLPRLAAAGSAVAAVALLGPLFGYYVGLVFLRAEPDYRAGYPATKPALYWTSYAQLPPQDFFGFPHQAGWKAIGALYAQGVLQGEYDSNEGGEITTWYVADGPRYACKPLPKYYFLADSVVDAAPVPRDALAADFDVVGQVTVHGRPGIHLYQRKGTGPAPRLPVESTPADLSAPSIAVENWAGRFDQGRAPWNHLLQMGRFVATPLAATFGREAVLLGYGLDATAIRPGGQLALTLYWRRAGLPIRADYKVFVHLEADRLWASADDAPGCGIWPTSSWRANEVIADRHVLDLSRDLPAGELPLSIGLYRPDTGARLEVSDAAGLPQGDALILTRVPVRP
jgi:4-amino-4-deoxy-L-arabinose transferase-like glycosyltransferase